MKQNRLLQLALSFLMSVWISGSLAFTAIRSAHIACPVWLALAVCAGAGAFGVLVSINRLTAALAGISAVGAGVYMCVAHLDALQAFLLALSNGALLEADMTPALLALAVLWTLFLFAVTHTRGAGFMSLAFTLLYWLMIRAVSGSLDVSTMPLTLVGVAAMFAVPTAGRVNYLKALLPTALVAALVAALLLPPEGFTCAPLAEAAQRVRNMFDAYFSFTDTRVPYSIYMDGYQPLGESLGGPAEPHEWPVMEVQTDKNLYLRGSIRRTYVNTAWIDASANNRYLFGDLMNQSVRDGVFEVSRIGADDPSGAFERASAQMTMLSEGTSTLFVPHRLVDLSSPLDLAVYYNSVGEVFITRDVQPQDAYGVTALIPTWNAQAMQACIEAHASDEDPLYRQAASEFMQLPSHIESGVYVLVNDVIAGAVTPYQRAMAIEEYLERNYSYTLTPDYPRTDIDFVSDFLLNGKKGYCSYFASAMAVMGRIAGLPTRYVEGYRVAANSSGISVVTGKNAHAWVEVYFNGVGWVTFDPTPGSGFDAGENSVDAEQGDEGDGDADPLQGDQPIEEPTQAPDPGAEQPTPEPTQAPEGGDEAADVTPEPTQPPEDGDSPDDMPTLPPLDEPTPPPDDGAPDDPQRESGQNDSGLRRWALAALVLLLLILALLALVSWLRLRASDPNLLAQEWEDHSQQALVYYRAILTLLETLGQVPESGETPVSFSRRLSRMSIGGQGFMEFALRLYHGQYAGGEVTEEAVELGRAAYEALVGQLNRWEKLRWRWARIRHGMGSIEQIP